MSWIVAEISVEEFFGDRGDSVVVVVLQTEAGIFSVDIREHVDELCQVIAILL
jgi:hypothetical protein